MIQSIYKIFNNKKSILHFKKRNLDLIIENKIYIESY